MMIKFFTAPNVAPDYTIYTVHRSRFTAFVRRLVYGNCMVDHVRR
jgi:hypothetical protein